MGDVLRPPRHGAAPGPGRGGRTTKASSAAAARRSSAPTTRRRSRSSWSWSPATPRRRRRSGSSCVLTVAEEQGLRGAKAFDTSALRSRAGFVLDHAGPVGEVIVATPTQQKILADFIGVEAHAGIRPEDGSSAIAAAAAAIARHGAGPPRRADDRQRRPDRGRHLGQRRPRPLLDPGRGAQPRRRAAPPRSPGRSPTPAPGAPASTAATSTCGSKSSSAATRCPSSSPALALAEAGLRGAGLEPVRAAIGGGSDANAFRLDGFDCVLLANGTDAVHTADEHVPAAQPREDARGLRGDRRRGGRAAAAGAGEA